MESKTTNYQSVSDAYAGKSILVTGGTGFLGKVFMEKILYSCPKVSKIYMLIRDKRNVSIEDRLKNMFSIPMFDRLRNERPQDLAKIIPVAGDIVLPKLGLKPEDEERIINEVSMVFHIAATVNFDESLQKALNINLFGTKKVLQLTKRIQNIEAFIYVSTAYSNPNVEVVEEVLHPPQISFEEAEEIVQRTFVSQEETSKILGTHPNTYTLTKGLAENYVAEHHGGVPTAIVKPSIVVSSKSEPMAGWVDSWAGAARIVFSIAKSMNNTLLTDDSHYIDLIPVDFVANGTIVAATKLTRSKNVAVYNISTSSDNPITMAEFFYTSRKCVKPNGVSFPIVLSTFKFLVYTILYFQKIFAVMADWVLFIVSVEPRFVKLQSIIVSPLKKSESFTLRSWTITARNTRALFESLSETDQKCFDFNVRNIVWAEFVSTFVDGINEYLYKTNHNGSATVQYKK